MNYSSTFFGLSGVEAIKMIKATGIHTLSHYIRHDESKVARVASSQFSPVLI
jgi:hypothetical protein